MSLRYKILHEDVYRLHDEHLAPALTAALRGPPGDLSALAREVAPGVFALPMFTPDFCARLRQELHRRERFADLANTPLRRPNSMNRDGLMLDEVGFEALLDDLLETVAAPLGRALFAHVGGQSLDHHHGFTVEYAPDGDRELSLHIDDAEVTLNVCLGDTFDGGGLRVLGHRCLAHASTRANDGEEATVAHAVGTALVHAGALRHLAEPVTAGRRVNLILWCRSSRFRRAHGVPARCGPWCDEGARRSA
jgi:hypothetical protein